MNENIIGTWILKKFTFENETGSVNNWDENAKGLLIYTRNGFMSASLCGKNDSEFYSGRYEINENTVIHKVENATDRKKLNNNLHRNIKLSDDKKTLFITAEEFCPGKVSNLIWEKSE
ncbi:MULTISPECIES: lipocalin-like domain-containing protein [Fluviispira]|uniref:Lipocalin-like domain-containing protein n=1 Tax=Fluviispira sanaruensis TaxID=2493639 RepID=A0A4P2VKR2_FLUSA|nr:MULTISPECIES: lipocalin-like domain-containing protein [Fluviispira]BBH53866.1 hypothetical protein JCM31447_23190 [Fluviispira sanaruensis]